MNPQPISLVLALARLAAGPPGVAAAGLGSARAPDEARSGPRAVRAAGCGARRAALSESACRLDGGPPAPVRAGFPAAGPALGS